MAESVKRCELRLLAFFAAAERVRQDKKGLLSVRSSAEAERHKLVFGERGSWDVDAAT